jgi:hypothetical protein
VRQGTTSLPALALLATLFVAGCAAHIPLAQQIPPIDDTGLSTIAVSVVDDRDRVKKGKPRNFVGVAHGVFGIPFGLYIDPSMAVEDGGKDRDLSQFLQYRIVQGFIARGWKAAELALEAVPDDEKARVLLGDVGTSAVGVTASRMVL